MDKLNMRSFRLGFGEVGVRADSNSAAADLFRHGDTTFRVLVWLDTDKRELVISVNPDFSNDLYHAGFLAYQVWGEGRTTERLKERSGPFVTAKQRSLISIDYDTGSERGHHIWDARKTAESLWGFIQNYPLNKLGDRSL